MDIRVIGTGLEYDAVLTNQNCRAFEYVENAFELAEQENDREVVEVYSCSLTHLGFADLDEDGEFEGYGVLTHDDWGDPVLL